MRDAGLGSIEQIRVSGGGAKSPLWRQILADVLEAELVTVNTTEGAGLGAALLAGVGIGTWPSVDAACAQAIVVKDRVCPDQKNAETYRTLHQQYQNLYPNAKVHISCSQRELNWLNCCVPNRAR